MLVHLSFSDVSCGPNSFMCLDGSCISLSRLCNFRRDCEDGDDENDCGNFFAH